MSDKIREATLEAIEKKWTEAARLGCIDAFPSALNEAWQSALAQQPSPAVPDGWKLVPVELTPEMYSAFGYVKSVPFDIWKKVLAAAPAPAAQEPAAWDVFYADDDRLAHTVRTKAEADRYSGMAYYVKPLHYIAPPAAEQPYSTTSDRYRAELYDEAWEEARALGFGNVTEALSALARQQLDEQPDTVKVPRELLAELRAFTLEYDSGRAGVMRGHIDALLGKEGE